MRKVYVTGVGMSKFGTRSETELELFAEAALEALESAEVGIREIDALFFGNSIGGVVSSQGHMAPLVATFLGLDGIPVTRFEDACSTSSNAFRHAFLEVAFGAYDLVLVGGVEKLTKTTGMDSDDITRVLALAESAQYEQPTGLTFPGVFALIARRHMYEYGTTEKQMALVAVKNHRNGALNPKAQFRKEITIDEVFSSPLIADPLKLYDCSPLTDGAAAIVLASEERARLLSKNQIRILGIGQTSDSVPMQTKKDLIQTPASRGAARLAYEQAGLGPNEIDFAEVHDCFTIAEIIAMEALGFWGLGEAGKAVEEGRTALDGGDLPINPSGGLKAKGHPVAASGAAQIIEVTEQLLGRCGKRQVKTPEVGLAHNVGGSMASAVVSILGRER